jgi:hypothetical protein
MDSDHGLRDLRFEGYDNEALAQQVDGLRGGAGAESLHNAARALITLAGGLSETDRVLREQLQQIGVSWQGVAAEGGTQATQDASVYANEAVQPVDDSAAGVATQSGEFSHTRNSAPESSTLRGPSQLNGIDRFAGAFGHTTDHARDVQATNAARDQAISGLNGYQQGSSDALGRARELPVPPGMDLVTRPADAGHAVAPVGGFPGGGGFTPGGGSSVPGFPGGGLTGGPESGLTGPPSPGGTPGTPGAPGTPGNPGVPQQPGGRFGVGPVTPPPAGLPLTETPISARGVPSLFVADAAAIAGAGAQGAAVGSAAEKDRLVRGRPGGPGTPGATPEEGHGKNPPKGATPLGAEPEHEGKAASHAERYGAKPGKPAGSPILQPATGAAPNEEDGEHVRRFGVESGDLFEDSRPTAPDSIGGEDDPLDLKADNDLRAD